MADLKALYDEHKHLPDDAQIKAGKAISGAMAPAHQEFLDLILKLLRDKSIDPADPKSFLNTAVYEKLPQGEKDKIDLALINLGHLLEHIVEFRLSKSTPDSSPQLETMLAELQQMKSRIEDKAGDVFKF